jgi:hypothetical protein
MIDFVHNNVSMKFGIYSDSGLYTCAGQNGSWGREEIDAATFAEWGVDCEYCLPACSADEPDLKYDDCNVPLDVQDPCAFCEYPDYDCPNKYDATDMGGLTFAVARVAIKANQVVVSRTRSF